MADPTLARLVDHERWPVELSPPTVAPHAALVAVSTSVTSRDDYHDSGILWRWHADAGHWLPDPDDHATAGVLLGVLLALDPLLDVSGTGGGSVSIAVQLPSGAIVGEHAPTLGRACVPALAAAWHLDATTETP